MFTLNEALKIAGLPQKNLNEEADAQVIFNNLKSSAKSPEEKISGQEEKLLVKTINSKLKDGWTVNEIKSYMKWMEYFNVEDDEDYCLKKMAEAEKKAKDRIASEKK